MAFPAYSKCNLFWVIVAVFIYATTVVGITWAGYTRKSNPNRKTENNLSLAWTIMMNLSLIMVIIALAVCHKKRD